MRTRWALLSAVAVFGLGWTAGQVFSQDGGMGGAAGGKKEEAPASGMPNEEEMKAWMAAMTPGEPHKQLAEHVGEWTTAVKMWMDPKGEPTTEPGTASFKMILGGRFQTQEVKGSMMGMPFEGYGITGYDNVAKEYTNVWMDSMGTMIMTSRGKKDASGTLTMRGEFTDPMHPEGPSCKVRMVMAPPGKDSFKFEMYGCDSKHPEEFKCMEIEYTRKK